jgi:NAD+ synthase
MVLSTGNKSEVAVGYATLYGDMCGGYNVLKDVYKTQVFELSKWRNEQDYLIPDNIITKPPSAELAHHQKDEDSLPPYPILDAILKSLIEKRRSVSQLVHEGFDRATVLKIRELLDRAEYKRRQAPPGVKITKAAFGRERRVPITNHYENN